MKKNSESYMNYETRENYKRDAYKIINSNQSNFAEKAHALLYGVITSHYWRARIHLKHLPVLFQKKIHGKRYCKGYRLDIDIYTRHWLEANGRNYDIEIIKEIKNIGYEPELSHFLLWNKTCYNPFPYDNQIDFDGIFNKYKMQGFIGHKTCCRCGKIGIAFLSPLEDLSVYWFWPAKMESVFDAISVDRYVHEISFADPLLGCGFDDKISIEEFEKHE